MKTSIFMTGGTGFFGKSILSMLKRGFASEYEFTILSRNPEKFLSENPAFSGLKQVSFVRGDVRDFTFPTGHWGGVIHAGTPAMLMPPGVERDIILKGTERVLEFARKCGAQKLMFVSSGAVYGTQPPKLEKLPESFPCSPVTEYGIAKLEAEKMCLASGIPTLIPRCFAFTGPYLNREIHFAIGNFIRDALAGDPIVILGDGRAFRSYLYADDLVEWLFALWERGKCGIPYNVGSDDPVSIAALASTVRDVLGSSSQVEIRTAPRDDVPASRYIPDVSRITLDLEVKQRFSLEDAIRRSAEKAE